MIKQLTIFGVGLIGGSLAMALRQAGYCEQIVGCSRSAVHLQRAQDLGVIDRFSTDPAEAVKDADMVLLAVPMRAMRAVLESIKPALSESAIITDAGSTKVSVIREIEAVFGAEFDRFVAGHPIAGREKTGVEAALVDLFTSRRVILTPMAYTNPQAVESVRAMWQQTGAVVESMNPELHDQVLAGTSHLPHVLAFSFVDTLHQSPQSSDILRYAAGGFKDFSRIASSDPVMWRDICLTNSDAVVGMIEAMRDNLGQFADLIRAQDAEGLEEVMGRAKQVRDDYMARYDVR